MALSPSIQLAGMFRDTALTAIDCYQRYVSPYKGYRCAHRGVWGGRSCSQYAQRAIARAGLWRGLLLLRRRLHACAHAAGSLHTEAEGQDTDKREKSFGESVFGRCNPAVQAGRELCCGSIIGGLQQQDGRH
jgi:putative component of membrane protein insertase Oxa1/YidC/SpoIIIJ protein YidD